MLLDTKIENLVKRFVRKENQTVLQFEMATKCYSFTL